MTVPTKPRLCKYFHYVPMGFDTLQVRTGSRALLLKGKSVVELFPILLPHLDGTKNLEDIVRSLKVQVSEKVVRDCVRLLYDKGILEDASIGSDFELPPEEQMFYGMQLSYFAHFHSSRFAYQRILRDSSVAVIQQGPLADHVVPALAVCGIGTIRGADAGAIAEDDVGASPHLGSEEMGKGRAEILARVVATINPHIRYEGMQGRIEETTDIENLIAESDLVILCGDRASFPLLELTNAVCHRKDKKWTSGVVDVNEGTVGPSVIPFETPCYECYRLRSDSNDAEIAHTEAFRDYLRTNPDARVEPALLHPVAATVGNILAAEAVRLLTGYSFPKTLGSVLRISFHDWEIKTHEILKIPWCPSCGIANKRPTTAAFFPEERKDHSGR